MNGLYDAVCIITIFPVLVHLGASGKTTGNLSSRLCKFLGIYLTLFTRYIILLCIFFIHRYGVAELLHTQMKQI